MDAIASDMATRKSIQMQTDDDIKELRKDVSKLEKETARLNADLENEGDNTITLAEQVQKAKDAQDSVRDELSNLFREDLRVRTQLEGARPRRRGRTFGHGDHEVCWAVAVELVSQGYLQA